MSDPVIRRVRRSIDEAKNRGGMRAGMPKVTIDAADAERLCILSEGLIKATSKSGWHERQKWAVEEQLTTVQAENEALLAMVAELEAVIGSLRVRVIDSMDDKRRAAQNWPDAGVDQMLIRSSEEDQKTLDETDYAQRLRQQADELEAKTAGGSDEEM